MMVETYLRRGQRSLQRWLLDPRIRSALTAAAYGSSGFLMSAASIGSVPQPLAMGLICATTGWRALVMTLGAMVGYPTFWGMKGSPGIVWSAAGGLLALLVGKLEQSRDQPLMIPALTAFLAAVTELAFWLILRDETPLVMRLLRVMLTWLSGVLFTQVSRGRDAIADWLAGGVAVLALAQVSLGPLGLGYLAAGVMAVGCAFPGAVLAGLGLDLARICPVPMTAVLCLAWFLRLVPYDKRWQHYTAPGVAYLLVSASCGVWDTAPLPGLVLGGAMGALLPPRPSIPHRRGETGAAQVRLELGAEVMGTLQQILLQTQPPPIDEAALLDRARDRACSGCSQRRHCTAKDSFTTALLQDPLEADCPRQSRLIPQLRRSREQLRQIQADRRRQEEYRQALIQQYRFLGDYLRAMADRLPRRAVQPGIQFRVETAARSRGKQPANGDTCLAFPGTECKYYVLLCDGMGTGLGAAQEGHSAASLLRQLLVAGFPAEHSLRTLNSLLALRGSAGAVTVDLAEVHLDSGIVHIFKWGAAPSYVIHRGGSEKIGTATPPPGISLTRYKETVEKLSLRRGEVLMLLSDGVDGEAVLRRGDLTPDAPPGELAAKILENSVGSGEDDATAAAIKLRPASVTPS